MFVNEVIYMLSATAYIPSEHANAGMFPFMNVIEYKPDLENEYLVSYARFPYAVTAFPTLISVVSS